MKLHISDDLSLPADVHVVEHRRPGMDRSLLACRIRPKKGLELDSQTAAVLTLQDVLTKIVEMEADISDAKQVANLCCELAGHEPLYPTVHAAPSWLDVGSGI